MNMRKCKGIEEVAMMEVTAEEEEEVSVSMGARAAKMKKRKLSGGELSFSSSLVQLKQHRRIAFTVENSTSPEASENSNDNLSSPSPDHAPASCCSSNASSQFAKQNFKVIDPQEEEEASSVEMATSETNDIVNTERSETALLRELQAESAELESATTAPPFEGDSRRPSPAKMPSDAEIEEFFSAAEKDIQKQFAEKYNFDFVKEEPVLEGRYEWVPVKP